MQEIQIHFYSTPTFSFKGSLGDIFKPTQLTSPVPFRHYYGTFIFFFFLFCPDNGIRVSECWKTRQNYYSGPVHLTISLSFCFVSYYFSIKSLTLPLHANIGSRYQQGETALSEILERTSAPWDKLINWYNLLRPLKMSAAPAYLIWPSAQKKAELCLPLDLCPITIFFWVAL